MGTALRGGALLRAAALGTCVMLGLSSCALVTPSWFRHQERVSTDLIERLHAASLPAGFTAEQVLPGCGYGIDCQDSNARFVAYRDGTFDHAAVCKDVIEFARGAGAQGWRRDPEYVLHLFTDSSMMGAFPECVLLMSLASATQGSTQFSLYGQDPETEAPILVTLWAAQTGGTHAYGLEVTTAYSNPTVPDDITTRVAPPDWVATRDLLNRMAAARTSSQDYLTVKQAEAALADGYPGTVTLVTAADGFVHALDVKPDSGMLEPLCLSVDPWNSQVTGIPDPGGPYDVFYSGAVLSPSFGLAVSGPCSGP